MKWEIDRTEGRVYMEGKNYISGEWYIKNKSIETRKGVYELYKNGELVKAFDRLKDAKKYPESL